MNFPFFKVPTPQGLLLEPQQTKLEARNPKLETSQNIQGQDLNSLKHLLPNALLAKACLRPLLFELDARFEPRASGFEFGNTTTALNIPGTRRQCSLR